VTPANATGLVADHTAAPVFAGVVALDGPSGTGKSTVARRLAARLGLRYLDTGAMYRAATLAVLRADADPARPEQVIPIVTRVRITVDTDPDAEHVELDGEPVEGDIRSAEVTAAVSEVSAIPEVRELLVAQQRRVIGTGRIVVEGRDIGSVVWPAARPKVYLTANAGTRAQRRADQLGDGSSLQDVAAGLDRRDQFDSSRTASPLIKAADAVELDTTDLDADDVVERVLAMTLRESGGG
jgi:cytidylate kinase